MKKTTLLLSAAAVLGFALLATPRGAMSGDRLIDASKLEGILSAEIGESDPPPVPSIFDNLQTFTGRVTSMSATPIGSYTCKDGGIKLNVRTGFSRGIIHNRELSEDSPSLDALLLLLGAPVKVTVNVTNNPDPNKNGPKTILIPAVEAERFKAVLSILHTAKLTSKDVTVQVPTASVPNCPPNSTFYAADVTFN